MQIFWCQEGGPFYKSTNQEQYKHESVKFQTLQEKSFGKPAMLIWLFSKAIGNGRKETQIHKIIKYL